MDFDEIRERLQHLDTSHISDADKSLRVLDAGIRPVGTNTRLIGRARTVRCIDDFLTVLLALGESGTGEVLVVDSSESRSAVAGELFATEASRRGLAGIVVDGLVRDVGALRKLSMPVYARGTCPRSGTTERLYQTQVPIFCGGVEVKPGDVLFGDDDGIVVGSVAAIAEAIPIAESIRDREERVLAELAAGASLFDSLNVDEAVAAVRDGKPGRLAFAKD